MKILSPKLAYTLGGLTFFCPGCDAIHKVWTQLYNDQNRTTLWQWDGDPIRPTFSPSVLVSYGPDKHCHSFIRNGQIQYLQDCHHELAGKTVDLPDLPNWFIEGEYIKP